MVPRAGVEPARPIRSGDLGPQSLNRALSEAPRPSRQDGTGTPGPFDPALRGTHGPEYIEWASREVNIVLIVPLNPAYPALAGTGRLPDKTVVKLTLYKHLLSSVRSF